MSVPLHFKIPWRWFPWGDGFTLGPIVFIRPGASEALYQHELVHVRQFWDEPLTFWVKYLYYTLRYGYRSNPYEQEAYQVQRRVRSDAPY